MDRLSYSVKKPIFDALGVVFTPQQQAVVEDDGRFAVVVGGERGGKTWVTAYEMVPHIVYLPQVRPERFLNADGTPKFDEGRDKPRNPNFVLFGPTYKEPKQEFQVIEDALRKLGLIAGGINKPSKPQEGPWMLVTTYGVVVTTWSMEDSTSIRGLDLEGAAVCEAGNCAYEAVERVFGRVSAKRGFIIYSGTMEESYQWYQDWAMMGKRANDMGLRSFSLPMYSNIHEYPGGRTDPEILFLENKYPDDVFAMRVLAEARPPRSRVLKEFTPEHIKTVNVPLDADLEVWIDPGYSSAYAVLFVAIWDAFSKKPRKAPGDWKPEKIGKRFHVFDEFYEQGLTTDDIIDLVKAHKAWKRIRRGVMDIAGKGHRDAGDSALEKWQKRTELVWNMRIHRELALIERIRTSAKAGRVTIDPNCTGLIAELGLGAPVFEGMHPWRYLTDHSGRVTGERPVDKWNHSCKALGYGLMHHLGPVERVIKPTSFNRLKTPSGNPFDPDKITPRAPVRDRMGRNAPSTRRR